MDQKFVAGLGNIYVNEAMFFSKTNTFPVNEGRIQENINNQKTDLSNQMTGHVKDSLDLIT